LKSSPSAYVVDQNHLEIGRARLNIADELLQGRSAIEAQTTLARIGVRAHHLDAAALGVLADLSRWFSVKYC
jgi:hypothetical protein